MNEKDKKLAIFGSIIITIVLISCFSVIGLFITSMKERPIEFNPILDGNFDSSEGWDNGEGWYFVDYLIATPDHLTCENHFYIHLVGDELYIMMDLVSDITQDEEGEFISVWIDGDLDLDYYYNSLDWNNSDSESRDMFCYYPESGYNDYAKLPYYSGFNYYESTLNDLHVDIACNFTSSPNGKIQHRIYECMIKTGYINDFNSSGFGIAFAGYGTLASPIFMDDWSSPTEFQVMNFFYGYIEEYSYFRCYSENSGDMNNPPVENPFIPWII